MAELTKKEITDLFMDFLNELGIWSDFESFIEKKGYTLEELSMEDE